MSKQDLILNPENNSGLTSALVMNVEICDMHLSQLGLSGINWTTDGVSISAVSSQVIEGYFTFFYCKGEIDPVFSKCLIKFISQRLEFVSLNGRASQLLIDQLFSGSNSTKFEATLEGARSDSRAISFCVDVGFAEVPTSIEQLIEENKSLKKQIHELEDAYSQLLNKKVETEHKRSRSADDAGLIGRVLLESNLISNTELRKLQPEMNSDQLVQLAVKKVKRLRTSSAELTYQVKTKEDELDDLKHQHLPPLDSMQLPIKFGNFVYFTLVILTDCLWKVRSGKLVGEDSPTSQTLTHWKKAKSNFKSPPTDLKQIRDFYLKHDSVNIAQVLDVLYYAHTSECRRLIDSCESHVCDFGPFCFMNELLTAKTQPPDKVISFSALMKQTVKNFFKEGIFSTNATRDGVEFLFHLSTLRDSEFFEYLHSILELEPIKVTEKIE